MAIYVQFFYRRILKYLFLLALLSLVALSIFIATQKGDFEVERSKVINSPKEAVFSYVNDYKNWETFGSWMQKDSDIKFNYDAKTIGAGAKCAFENGSDEGNIRTVFVKENDSLAQKANFNGTTATISWTFKDTVGGTKVIIHSKGKMGIMTKITSFFNGGITSILGDVYEKSLRNLDKTLNYEMKTYSIKVNGIVQRTSGYCLKQSVSCHIKSVGKNTKILMARMVHFFKKNKIIFTTRLLAYLLKFINFVYFKNVRNFVQIHFMTKVLSVTEFRSNLAVELDHVGGNDRNQIIIKRPKGKGNVVVLSQDAFNSIQETLYLLSNKANKANLMESIKELKAGKTKKINLKDLWK